jgi:C4-dicarboxylate transporter, DctM subunit
MIRAVNKKSDVVAKSVDIFTVVLVGALVLIPVINVISRKIIGVGFSSTLSLVQHLTLWVCYLGAAIAARKGDLLSIGDASSFLPEHLKQLVKNSVGMISVSMVTIMFIAASMMLQVEFEFGKMTNFGLPVWVAQLAIPIGYGLIIFRLIQQSCSKWQHYVAILIFTALVIYIGSFEDLQESGIIWIGIIVLLIVSVFKLPIFIALGGIALLLFWNDDTVISSFTIEIYSKIATNDALAALPLFTLAGFIMAEGGAPKRLIKLFQDLFGWIPGGVAVATITVCTFFTTFTGASGVTILAMGGLLKPALDSRGYSEKTSIGLITGASSMGVLFPPSLPLILYGCVAFQPIPDMFIGAFIPGLLLYFMVVIYGMYRGFVELSQPEPFNLKNALNSLWEAKLEAFMPLFVLIFLFSGLATLVETAAFTVIYAIVSEFLIHKDLGIKKDLIRVVSYSSVLIGGVLIILTSALGFTNYMIDAEIPTIIIDYVQIHVTSPLVFLFYLNIFLFVAGCVMDVFTAIVIISPLLVPLAQAFEINPVHIGVVFLVNLSVGYLTPPVGMNLFISSYRFKKSMPEVYIATLPILLISVAAVFIITYIPWISTFLLDLTGGLTNVNIPLDKFQ